MPGRRGLQSSGAAAITGALIRLVLCLLLVAGACARSHVPRSDASGFLDDYALLRPGGPDDVALVYRNPDARWTTYRSVLLEPVTLWRSGRGALDAVPEGDLLRLVADFERTVRRRLGQGFALVQEAGPGVMRIRLGITEARATDANVDVLTAHGGGEETTGTGPLDPEMRRFLEAAEIEGEIRDAVTDELLAEGIDRRRRDAPPLATWADVDRALDFWAERMCARLEARTGRR